MIDFQLKKKQLLPFAKGRTAMKKKIGWFCVLAAVISVAMGTKLIAQTAIRIDVQVEISHVKNDPQPRAWMPYLELHTAFHQGADFFLIPAFEGGFGLVLQKDLSNFREAAVETRGETEKVGFDVTRADGVRHWVYIEHTVSGEVRQSGEILLSGAVLPPPWARRNPFNITTCSQSPSRGTLWYRVGNVRVADPGGPIMKGKNLSNPCAQTPQLWNSNKESAARWENICAQSIDLGGRGLGYVVGSFSWADLTSGKPIELVTDYDEAATGKEGWKDHLHIAATLTLAEDVMLIVRAQGYDSWKPEPGTGENSPGPRPLSVGFELVGLNGRPPLRKVVRFELELQKTSREPGITLNMPLAPAGVSGPDLRLVAAGVPPGGEGQTANVPSPDGRTGSAGIAAYDGGGWSTLVVKAVLDNGTRVTGHFEKPDGPSEILLPKREAGSKIAISWLAANGNPRDDADIETTPGNAHPGDGLSAYEEYRGLVVKGKYRRLDPGQKELLIEVEKKFAAGAQTGLNLFGNASRIMVIALDPGELAQDRVINRNAGNGHLLSQHALRLEQGSLPEGEAGVNQPKEQKGKTPKDSQRVVIDSAQIDAHVRKQAAAAVAAQVTIPYVFEGYLAVTIAHEIAHGVGVDHHGPSSNLPKRTVEKHQTNFKIYGSNRREIEARPWEIDRAGPQGCESSGDLGCLMAYTDMYQWAYENKDGLHVYRKLPILPLGTRFCTSDKGTGINDPGPTNPGPPYFGNATWGDCAARLRVRD
jgi:hypothetical protein